MMVVHAERRNVGRAMKRRTSAVQTERNGRPPETGDAAITSRSYILEHINIYILRLLVEV
jgi:hypothetical protein